MFADKKDLGKDQKEMPQWYPQANERGRNESKPRVNIHLNLQKAKSPGHAGKMPRNSHWEESGSGYTALCGGSNKKSKASV